VNRDQASALLALLQAAYPRTKVPDETVDLWLSELGNLDHAIGEAAVRSVIKTVKFWPSPAHLHEQVADLDEQARLAKEQTDREQQRAGRIEADRAFDELPRPQLREIPAAVELLERFSVLKPPPPLELAPDGACEDGCGAKGLRYHLGRFQVCADCARRRLRAADQATVETKHEAA
jgi:hypothetical protein